MATVITITILAILILMTYSLAKISARGSREEEINDRFKQ